MAFLRRPSQRTRSLSPPLRRGLSESCLWTLRHAWRMKSSEPLKGVMSEAGACLRKNEFRGLALLSLSAGPCGLRAPGLFSTKWSLSSGASVLIAGRGGERKGWAYQFSSFPAGYATAPVSKGRLLKRHPPLPRMLDPHPNQEAKKHTKCIRAGSRKRRQETMRLFRSITGLIHAPSPRAQTSHRSPGWPLSVSQE